MAFKNPISIINKIKRESRNSESYNTGLAGEHIIVSAYKTMTIDQLEKLRFIMNKLIKKKKEMKRVNEAKKYENNKN